VGRLVLLYVSVVWFLYRLLTRVSAWFCLTHGRVLVGRPTRGRSAGPMSRRSAVLDLAAFGLGLPLGDPLQVQVDIG